MRIRGFYGFTIIEVLVVLVVAGGLAFLAISMFSGPLERSRFSTSVRDVENKILDIINDVNTGYYPKKEDINCNSVGGAKPDITVGSTEQGKNQNCIFIGKAVQIDTSSGNNNKMTIYTIVAPTKNAAGNDYSSLDGSIRLSETFLKEIYDTKNNEIFKTIRSNYCTNKTPSQNTIGFAVVTTFGRANGVVTQNGAIYSDIIPICSDNSFTSSFALNELADRIGSRPPNSGVEICMDSQYNNQKGIISVGTGNQAKSTLSKIETGVSPC